MLLLCSLFWLLITCFEISSQPASVTAINEFSAKTSIVSFLESHKSLPPKRPFINLKGRFSIMLPSQTTGSIAYSPDILGINAEGHELFWYFQQDFISVTFVDFKNETFTGSEQELQRFITNGREGPLEERQAKITGESRLKIGEIPAAQLNFSLPDGRDGIIRICLVSSRVYTLYAAYNSQNIKGAKEIVRAVKTFKVLTQKEVDELNRSQTKRSLRQPIPTRRR